MLSRIDRLEEDVRRTLQLASVIGRSFLYRLLEAIAEAERKLDQHLAQLQRVDLVREKTRRPELEYIFKHSLTQEAVYNSLLVERRKESHRKVGAALDRKRLSEILFGPDVPPARGGLIPPGLPGHSPELGPGYDLEAARRLLAEAGYPDAKGFPRLVGQAGRVFSGYVEEIARQWREGLGVEVGFQVFAPGTEPDWLDQHFIGWGWLTDYPDPDNFLRYSNGHSILRRSDWRDARYEELVQQAARTPDRARRLAMYREADRI